MTVHSPGSVRQRPVAAAAAGQGKDTSKAESDRAVKRDRILDAAEAIFARHGFFAAKVSQIAAEAGVADGTIYLYFKSKDDLLISLFETRMERLNSILAEAVAGRAPDDQLRIFIARYFELVAAEPAAAEVLTIELRQSSKFMHEYDNPRFADFLRMLGGIIAGGQQSGVFGRAIPPSMVARMIFGILDELVTAWVLSQKAAKDDRDKSPQLGSPPNDRASATKKFDIVQATDWVVSLVENGLSQRKTP